MTLRTTDHWEEGLFANKTFQLLAAFTNKGKDFLTGEEVALELLEDGIYCRRLMKDLGSSIGRLTKVIDA